MITYTLNGKVRFRTAQPASIPLAPLSVADPEESDLDFILHAFDSALPYLASIGSQAQWGTQPFSEKQKVREAFENYLEQSWAINSSSSSSACMNNKASWQHLTLYEIQKEGGQWTRVAAQGVSTSFPSYVPQSLAGKETRERSNYIYLNYLIADRRTGQQAKGAGDRLVAFAQEEARGKGKTIFFGDCWRGNGDGLMR
nr:conserved hypothetical protein [Melanopsichium pennsylvanicum 4]